MKFQSLVILTAIVFTSPNLSYAWEHDFHQGLTEFLARKAGFTRGDAKTIARANASHDEGPFSPVKLGTLFSCIKPNKFASTKLRDWHFPSHGRIPSQPKRRQVWADSRAARKKLNHVFSDEIQGSQKETVDNPDYVTREECLEDFGEALHTFQDSWAHEGIPSVPYVPVFGWNICDSQNISAHPDTRWGWRSHNADLTWCKDKDGKVDNVEATVKAAEKTFAMMKVYFEKTNYSRSSHRQKWGPKLKKEVRDFAKANSQKAKRKWFKDHKMRCDYCRDLNLPRFFTSRRNCGHADTQRASLSTQLVKRMPTIESVLSFTMSREFYSGDFAHQTVKLKAFPQKASLKFTVKRFSSKLPAHVRDFFQDFFRHWVTRQDDDYIDEFVDVKAVSKSITTVEEQTEERLPNDTNPEKLVFATFQMWRLKDHGLANALGHASPSSDIKDLLERIAESNREDSFIHPETVEEAMVPLGFKQEPYILGSLKIVAPSDQTKTAYVALAKFKHAVNDTVFLIAETPENRSDLRIVFLGWEVDHNGIHREY